MPQIAKVGDLVRYNPSDSGPSSFRFGWPNCAGVGVVIEDCSPLRPENVNRYVEVLWADGDICKAHSTDLDILHEGG